MHQHFHPINRLMNISSTVDIFVILIQILIHNFSDNVPHNFTCTMEVYSHQLLEDVSIASTPKKIKKKINELSSSVGRTVGRRLSGLVSCLFYISVTALFV